MTTRRSGAGVGVVDGLLYAVGGHDGPTVRKSAEVFNPQVCCKWFFSKQKNYFAGEQLFLRTNMIVRLKKIFSAKNYFYGRELFFA